MTGFRADHRKTCHFGILIILIKVTKSLPVQEKCWPSPVPLKARNKLTMWNTSFLYRKVERYLYHQRYGIKDCKGCINSRMTSLLTYNPQAQTSFSCHFLTNILVLCLKAIKIICFGHFFQSYISMISYMCKIWVCFFSLVNLPCVNLIFGQSKNQEGKKEKFPPNIIFIFLLYVCIFCNSIVVH